MITQTSQQYPPSRVGGTPSELRLTALFLASLVPLVTMIFLVNPLPLTGYILASALCWCVSYKYPVTILAYVMAIECLTFITDAAIDRTIPYEGLTMLMVVSSYKAFTSFPKKNRTRRTVLILVAYILLMIQADLHNSISGTIPLTAYFAALFLTLGPLQIKTKRDFQVIFTAIATFGVIISFWAIIVGNAHFRDHAKLGLINNGYNDANITSHAIGLGLLTVVFAFLQNNSTKSKLLLTGLISIILIALTIPVSRGAFVSLIAGLLAYLLVKYRFTPKTIIATILLNASVWVFLISPIGQGFMKRFTESDVATGNGRTVLQGAVLLGLYRSNIFELLFGHGSGSAMHAVGEIIGFGSRTQYPHSSFLQISYEIGLFGFLIITGLMLYSFIINARENSRESAIQCGLLAFIGVMALQLGPIQSPFCVVPLALALRYFPSTKTNNYKNTSDH